MTREDLIDDLRTMGVTEGDHIAVTLSLKKVGYIDGGPNTFIDAILDVIGQNGTLMMNTYTQQKSSNFVFDLHSSPAWTGLVPETMRKRPDAIRSRNPICSVAAIGKMAQYLTENHERTSFYVPYSRLANIDGKYLSIGLGHNLVAIRHEAQRLAGLFDVVTNSHFVQYLDAEGNAKTYVFNSPPCPTNLHVLVPILEKMNVLTFGNIGKARSIIASSKHLLDSMVDILKNNPTLTLCSKMTCLWCREIERKMKLYDKIENPTYFQKNFFVRSALAIINLMRIKLRILN